MKNGMNRRSGAWGTLCAAVTLCAMPVVAQDAKLGPAEAVAVLVERVRNRPVEDAWPAIAELRVCAADATRNRYLKKAVGPLVAIAEKDADRERRELAILCLGSTGRYGTAGVKPLVKILTQRPLSNLQISAAMALSQMGKPAAKALDSILVLGPPKKKPRFPATFKGKKLKPKELKNASQTTALLAMFAIVHLGKDASTLSKRMIEHLQNHAGFDSYILHLQCVDALAAMGRTKSAGPAMKKRHELEASVSRGGMVPGNASALNAMIEGNMGVKKTFPKLTYSLPEAYPVCAKKNSGGAMMLDFANHLVSSLGTVRTEFLEPDAMDRADWHRAVEPLVGTALVYEYMDSLGK